MKTWIINFKETGSALRSFQAKKQWSVHQKTMKDCQGNDNISPHVHNSQTLCTQQLTQFPHAEENQRSKPVVYQRYVQERGHFLPSNVAWFLPRKFLLALITSNIFLFASLQLVKPILPVDVEGLQRAFHLSRSRTIAPTPTTAPPTGLFQNISEVK